ncbi:nuclease-related domain-containing protein [Rhodopirellula sp. SWK7]|uniref:nuclease-related domain-containing protein n=1 Tax=Rhodopirellula sp. SWK7 TaxID=595460 RepID=UPI0002BF7701|nr:nuclease-related domain-containing protein [Rhodopirellula sp. SWK7]EMI44545.1 NERD domain-containing protein [Rhodopirellula sp. SWK7]
MIVKEKDSARPTDPMGNAGYEAEKQMAFFLRRAFAESDDVLVFNDVTFERNGERAQIDHLVLHRFGFVIVESKSITGTVEVNQHQEFVRNSGGRRLGMRSPIEQARLQVQLLQKLLNDAKESLRPKKLLGTLQPHFGDERFQVFVAISDKGVIERNGSNPPELMKAERVVKEIMEKSSNYQQTQGVKGFVKFVTSGAEEAKQLDKHHVGPFTDQEMKLVTDFLTSRYKGVAKEQRPNASAIPSRVAAKTEAASPKEASSASTPTIKCDACGGTDVEILYGRYGYYLQCRNCAAKKTVPQKCEVCDGKAKLRKKGICFYRDCETCGTQNLLHTNPKSSASS